jgi:hypothetical protein
MFHLKSDYVGTGSVFFSHWFNRHSEAGQALFCLAATKVASAAEQGTTLWAAPTFSWKTQLPWYHGLWKSLNNSKIHQSLIRYIFLVSDIRYWFFLGGKRSNNERILQHPMFKHTILALRCCPPAGIFSVNMWVSYWVVIFDNPPSSWFAYTIIKYYNNNNHNNTHNNNNIYSFIQYDNKWLPYFIWLYVSIYRPRLFVVWHTWPCDPIYGMGHHDSGWTTNVDPPKNPGFEFGKQHSAKVKHRNGHTAVDQKQHLPSGNLA